jgi:hypothetical protein
MITAMKILLKNICSFIKIYFWVFFFNRRRHFFFVYTIMSSESYNIRCFYSYRQNKTYWSSVEMTGWPLDPQSLLGPEILAQAIYHRLACICTGSSNNIGNFSLYNKIKITSSVLLNFKFRKILASTMTASVN